jgi:tRNA A-37 threonylcarbamoyl transferase component Bud32
MTAPDETNEGDRTSGNRGRTLRTLFEQAIRCPEAERSDFIKQACAGDPKLLGELENLLAHHEPAEEPADDSGLNAEDSDHSPAELHWVGRQIGDVTVTGVIGSGGMGTVYTARQDAPDRIVAVKILRDAIPSDRALRRFEYEAQLLARMNHPGIARVLRADIVVERGIRIPYFVMDLIKGAGTIIEHAEAKALDRRERLELFRSVCDAVGHAHQKGIIHRDLKPANVLVDDSDQVKVIDFGIAHSNEEDSSKTLFKTFARRIVGTPHYMAPEQFEQPDAIDTRIDVYALGVLLYELLLGRALHETDPDQMGMNSETATPLRPTSVDPSLKGDLEAIIMKSMARDPARRYADANALGDDITRFLDGQPVVAKPPTIGYTVAKIAGRNRTLLTAVATCLLILVAAGIFAGYEKSKADAEVRAALEHESRKTEVFEKILRRMSVSSVADQISHEDLEGPGREAVTETARSLMSNLIFLPSVEDLAVTGEENPDIAIELGITLGRFAWHAKLHDEQLAIAEQQLQWAQQLDPPDPLIVAKTHGYVASAQASLGDHEKALAAYQTKGEILATIPGPEARRAEWYVLNNSNASREALGQLDVAEAGYRETLELAMNQEEDSGMVDWSHRNLARVLAQQGKYEEAFEQISRCNTIRQILERSESILMMNQFYMEEALTYLVAVRNTGRLAEELAVSEVLCEFRSSSPEILSTPDLDTICERAQALRESLGQTREEDAEVDRDPVD